MNAVFVYGLLKPGFRLHHVVAPFVERVIPATARGCLYDARSSAASPSGGLPAARFDEEGEIQGFVLWLDPRRRDEALRILDELEDEGTEYRRIVVDVQTHEGRLRAFTYEFLLSLDGRSVVGPAWVCDRANGG